MPCPTCYPRKKESRQEREVVAFLTSLGCEMVRHDRSIIAPRELDIVLPALDLALEVNGTYWHGEALWQRGVDPAVYHEEKQRAAAVQGVKLLFLWEEAWRQQRPLMEELLQKALSGEAAHPLLRALTPEEAWKILNGEVYPTNS